MDAPVDREEEGHLVLVDLEGVQAGNLAPGAGRVVAVLKVLGGEDERSQEHAATALERADGVDVVGLLHGEVMAGDVRFDEDEVVEGNLQGGVARSRTAERLLDEGSEGEDALAAHLAAAHDRGEGPDRFNDLGGGIW